MASGLQSKENQEGDKLKVEQENRNKGKETEEKHKTSKHKWYHVNPNAISSKCAYFFECAMRSGLQPNLVMFFTSIGLNKAEAGFIVGLRMIGMILGGPFWGLIADKWHCHRIVILLMCITSLLTISTQPFVGLHFGNPETNKCPYVKDTTSSSINLSSQVINASNYSILTTGNYLQNNALSVSNRSNVTKSLKTSLYKNLTINSLDQNITFYSSNNARSRVISQKRNPMNRTSNLNIPRKVSESNQNTTQKDTYASTFGTLYFAMFSINFILSFAEGSAVGFVDSGTMRRSQLATTRPVAYGRQRMFSSFGGAFGILITNLAIDYFPASNITCYTGIFVVYGLFTVCYCISTISLFQGLSFYSKPTDLDTDCEDQREQTTDQKRLLGSQKYEKNDISLNKSRNNLRKTLIRTLSRPETIFFYLTTFVSGLEYSQSMNFLYPYLREMNAPSILLTLSVVFSNF
uniref:Major facilitator superfamily associated domain-containing protein n=2 Tax=Clytia hemisphaerica TaxID=252671 RepID=A0A7M5V3N2_9CNID